MAQERLLTKLDRSTAGILVIDMQEKLLPAVKDSESCVAGALRMLQAGQVLGLPVVATEQYPAGLGKTDPRIAAMVTAGQCFEKTRFSACIDPVMQSLGKQGRWQVIVVGVEAHVCVQQTVCDLIRAGLQVWVCVDAVGSRRTLDLDIAIARLRQAGAIVATTESVIFELIGEAGTEDFKKILKIVK